MMGKKEIEEKNTNLIKQIEISFQTDFQDRRSKIINRFSSGKFSSVFSVLKNH